jgi:putative N6-adenine-specific DNA methylase
MCGSGTFLIESAYKAMNIACGLRRSFAAQEWAQIPQTVWQNARAEAMDLIKRDAGFHGYGFDIDELAIDLTSANAKKAGVGGRLDIKQQDISKYRPLENCTLFCNPPYGERLLDIKSAEELYKKMGQVISPSKENPCYIISPHEEFEKFFGKKADKKRKLYNGMIKCDLYMYFR